MAAHWTAAWLGRPWQAGRFECIDLVLEVLESRSGRRPRLPPYAAAPRARDRQVAALANNFALEVDAPRDGDVALMRPVGGRLHGHHAGVVALVDAVPHVLHVARGGTACLHPAPALGLHGWELRGWYRWRSDPAPSPRRLWRGPTLTLPRRRGGAP